MRAASIVLVLACAGARAQDPARNADLHVAFVGDLTSARGEAFVAFLGRHFDRLTAIERAGCGPADLRLADVVVLDWHQQQQGVSQWLQDKQMPHARPLGELERWDRPTVLIGSAGLNIAADWGLPGTFG